MTNILLPKSITVTNSYGITFYVKGKYNFHRLVCTYNNRISDISIDYYYANEENEEEQNRFDFILTPKIGTSGAAYIPSELSYDDLFTNNPETSFAGSDIFIKKDSNFHKFLNTYGYNSYINTLKPYIYIGKLYPSDYDTNTIMIETLSLKDYVLNALPYHHHNKNIREFFGVAFDKVYSEIYFKMKDISSLSDPYEMPDNYLRYLLDTYNMTSVSSDELSHEKDRFYINNLPSLLKRKGTYIPFYVTWKILTKTSNIMSIYDLWHKSLPTSASDIKIYCDNNDIEWREYRYSTMYDNIEPTIPTSIDCSSNPNYPAASKGDTYVVTVDGKIGGDDGIDVIVGDNIFCTVDNTPNGNQSTVGSFWKLVNTITQAGAGLRYYSNITNPNKYWPSGGNFDYDPILPSYDTDDWVLSPHYRVEIDLSDEPLLNNEIINEDLYNSLLQKWEEIRPVTRYVDYSEVIRLDGNFSGRPIDTYKGAYNAYAITRCFDPVYGSLPDTYISYHYLSSSWYVNHNLQENDDLKGVIVQCYKFSSDVFTRVVPKSITRISNNVLSIEFNFPVTGYAFVASTTPDTGTITTFESQEMSINPSASAITAISTVYGETDYEKEIVPASYNVSAGEYEVTLTTIEPIQVLELEADFTSTFEITGSSYEEIIPHDLNTRALLIDVYKHNGDMLEKIFPINIIIDSPADIKIYFSQLGIYTVIIKKISNWSQINTIGQVIGLLYNNIKLGEGESTRIYYPFTSMYPDGRLQQPISTDDYELKSVNIFEPQYIDGITYDSYNIKICINALNNINITEIGLFEGTMGMENTDLIFYTACSPIFVPKGTSITLFYNLKPEVL